MSLENSKAYQYVVSKGWKLRTTDTQIILADCPITGCDNYHFFISYETEKDGLYQCHKCGESGNLYSLREYLGDRMENVTSLRDVATSAQKPGALPNVEACHRALMAEAESDAEHTALDYLTGRGYSMEVIEKYKLGLETNYGKRWLVMPYFHKDTLVYAKFRSIPPGEREFRGVSGRECPLFNQDVLTPGMEDLVMLEGEADTLACLSKGMANVVGIPGANIKKASWIKRLDDVAPKTIYILYDRDKVGQAAAREMAARIGIDKVKNILLPEFRFINRSGEEVEGKDVNEWFQSGHTLADMESLKAEAKAFDVDGIRSASELVEDIREILRNKGSLEPKWKGSAWDSFNKRLPGYEEGDLVGILAPEKIGKTSFAMNILDFLNMEYNEPVLMFCQEMQPMRMVRKWIGMVTDTDDQSITLETVDTALNIAANRTADYLFGFTKTLKRQEVFDTIRQAVRRYGIKFVCFDNLQLLCRSLDHNAQEISATTKEFKQLAMELGIVIFLIMQPHAMKSGEIVSARNVYGSSAPGKDVDSMVCLHRNRQGTVDEDTFASVGYIEVEESYSPEMLARVDLNRYSAGGATTLLFDGAKSKVLEFSLAQVELKKSLMPFDPGTLGTQQPLEVA